MPCDLAEFELPEQFELTIRRLNPDLARRLSGDSDPWRATFSPIDLCSLGHGHQTRWHKGQGLTLESAVRQAYNDLLAFNASNK